MSESKFDFSNANISNSQIGNITNYGGFVVRENNEDILREIQKLQIMAKQNCPENCGILEKMETEIRKNNPSGIKKIAKELGIGTVASFIASYASEGFRAFISSFI